MSEARSDRGRLLDEAIDLVIRHQNDPANPVTNEMIRAWRARSSDHEQTWARVAKVHGSSGAILTEQRRIERRDSLGLTRRNALFGGIATVGLGTLAMSFGPGLLLQARADHMTAKGEIRRTGLPDGSTATLGPESAIALDFRPGQRKIELLAGMCFFEIEEDATQPFSVGCADLQVTTVMAAFDISNDAGLVSVSVNADDVDVRAPDAALAAGERLVAGQWITYDPASGGIDRGEREPAQVASWRDRLVVADRETVAALVARIGRWVPGRVILADPFIGSQRVSGVYDLNDPLRALEAGVHPAGGRVRRVSSIVTVISPV
jgi:transmembrane sensor